MLKNKEFNRVLFRYAQIFTLVVLLSICSEFAFAQKKGGSSSASKERIRVLTSQSQIAEDSPEIYVSNFDAESVTTYEEINRKTNSIYYVSGWLNDFGIGISETKIKENFSYEDNSQRYDVYQDIKVRFFEISILFGDTFTAQPGFGYSDIHGLFEGTQTEYTNNSGIQQLNYTTDLRGEGYSYFINLGLNLWNFELLAGYRKEVVSFDRYEKRLNSIADNERVFKISGYNTIGLGITF